MIHVLCGRWPTPCEPVRVNPRNRAELLPVSEAERRDEYLRDIGNAHPLMDLILRCVSNDPQQRDTAAQIVQRMEHMTCHSPPAFPNRVEMLQQIRADATEKGSLREENETFAAEYEQSQLEREEFIQQHRDEVEQVRTEMRAQNETHEIDMRALNETHQAEMMAQIEVHQTQITELDDHNTAVQSELRGEIQGLEHLAQHLQEDIELSELSHLSQIVETSVQLQEALQTELRTQTESHQAEMRAQNETLQAEMTAQNETHQTEMRTQNEIYQAEMRAQSEGKEHERSLTDQLDSLQTEVLKLKGVNESLQVTVVSKDAILTQKESELASKNAILEQQSSTIREQNEKLTRTREFLSGQKPQV